MTIPTPPAPKRGCEFYVYGDDGLNCEECQYPEALARIQELERATISMEHDKHYAESQVERLEARVAELEQFRDFAHRRIDKADADLYEQRKQLTALEQERDKLREENERLRFQLMRVWKHTTQCPALNAAWQSRLGECTCGLRAALGGKP